MVWTYSTVLGRPSPLGRLIDMLDIENMAEQERRKKYMKSIEGLTEDFVRGSLKDKLKEFHDRGLRETLLVFESEITPDPMYSKARELLRNGQSINADNLDKKFPRYDWDKESIEEALRKKFDVRRYKDSNADAWRFYAVQIGWKRDPTKLLSD